MARPLRIEFPGALYHVISRGNERQKMVRDDADRQKRLNWLRRTVEVYGWRLHAFVLMRNHDPWFVETPEANLSAGMQHYQGKLHELLQSSASPGRPLVSGTIPRASDRAGGLFSGGNNSRWKCCFRCTNEMGCLLSGEETSNACC